LEESSVSSILEHTALDGKNYISDFDKEVKRITGEKKENE